jgi:hypothetical protein
MSRIEQPPETSDVVGPGADDLDQLLRRHFRTEMPHPWPAPSRLTLPFRATKPLSRQWRSRFTLAASVAALLIGSVWLAARSPEMSPTAPGMQEATNRKDLHRAGPAHSLAFPANHAHR